MSFPSNQMFPEVGDSRQARQFASVLLPDPDSPTTASVVPGEIVKDTLSRASNSSGVPARLRFVYRFTRFSTFKSGCTFLPVAASTFILNRKPCETHSGLPVRAHALCRSPCVLYTSVRSSIPGWAMKTVKNHQGSPAVLLYDQFRAYRKLQEWTETEPWYKDAGASQARFRPDRTQRPPRHKEPARGRQSRKAKQGCA